MVAPRITRKKRPVKPVQMFVPPPQTVAPVQPTAPSAMFSGPLQAAAGQKPPFDWASLAQGLGVGLLTGKNWGEGIGQGMLYARQFGDQRQQAAEAQRQSAREDERFGFEKQKYETELAQQQAQMAERTGLDQQTKMFLSPFLDDDPANDPQGVGLNKQSAMFLNSLPVEQRIEAMMPVMMPGDPEAPKTVGGMQFNTQTGQFEPIPGYTEQQAAIAAAGRAPVQPPAPPEMLRLMQAAGIDPASPEGQEVIRQKLTGATAAPSDRAKRAQEAGLQPGTKEYTEFVLGSDQATAAPKQENILRDEFNALTKDFRTVQDAFAKIQATSDTGAGDMSMLYSYVKLLDPGSVVRESEFATAAASGSFGQQVQGAVQRLLTGERLPPDLRQAFKNEANNIFQAQKSGYERTKKSYENLATRTNVAPENVIIDYAAPPATPGPSTPGGGGNDEWQIIDGVRIRKKPQ